MFLCAVQLEGLLPLLGTAAVEAQWSECSCCQHFVKKLIGKGTEACEPGGGREGRREVEFETQ